MRSVCDVPKLPLLSAMVIVLSLAGAVGVSAATPAQVIKANRKAAVGAADQVLGEAVMPAGAVEVPSEPAGDAHQLAHPLVLPIFAAEVDRHEFWTTTASPSEVIASIRAHLPAGARFSSSGSEGTNMFVSYSLPTAAPMLGSRTFVVDAVELSGGATGVRADAIARYFAPHLPTQRIPPRARVLQITMATPGAKPLLSLTVTRRAQVRRIAAMVDRLPFVASLRGVAISCPAIFPAPIDTFTFRGAPVGAVLAQVSEPANTPTSADICATTTLTIRGHRELGLLEGGVLLREAAAALGVKLTTRP
jgi:hypothetical protein